MKHQILIGMTLTAFALGSCDARKNPLLEPSTAPYQAPQFTEIRNEDYKPAFEQALSDARAEIRAITENPEAPTFANTIEALAYSGETLDQVSNIFFNLNEAHTNDTLQALALELSPMLTAFGNDITLDSALFARVAQVYAQRDSLAPGFTSEQLRLLDNTYKNFARNGAALSAQDKKSYRELTEKLSQLTQQFNQNVLGATNDFTLHLTDSTQLAGLPDFVRDGAASEAKERNLEGWVFTLQYPSMQPFLTYSSNRPLREKLWRAYNSRAFGGKFDNADNVEQIANLRLQVANLLGYATYADYVLEERMAESASTVESFLRQLRDRGLQAAHADVEQVTRYAATQGFAEPLMPWDFAYYSEKLKNEQYNISDELTKPYFPLDKVQKGVFLLAEKLYGISFKENAQIPVYHPDVKVYEVYDADGQFLSLLYMDFFPRASKRGGAWMTEFRGQSVRDGQETRPLISLVCNFTKPTENTPSLLTFQEVSTLLHEFGHALHGMFAQGTYPGMTGTSVYRDFVELPSQIMENWATEKEFLDRWAAHYQTGEPMPASLIQRIIAAKQFLAAYSHLRQLTFGTCDMAWHTITQPVTEPVDQFEHRMIDSTLVMPYIPGQCFSTSFSHIFAGGYAAGYYGYKWAEVLEADAFSLFREKGIFNREVANSFRQNILSKGNSESPMELYVRFRGHKPDIQPLFDKMGIK